MQGLDATDDYPEGPRWWLALAACVLVIMGAKLTLILFQGSAVPFWDQWDAEGGRLYRPYLQGFVPLSTFIEPHNEHRILISRLLVLGELEFAGRWDPILQMCINAMLHTACVVTLMVLLRRMVSATAAIALAAFVTMLVAIPFGWENVLAGFQSQFSTVLLFSIVSLALLAVAPAFDARWGIGFVLAVLGYFSLSAGGGTLLIAGVIAAAQVVIGRRRGRREWAGIAALVASGALLLALVPQPPYHASLKAQSIGQYFQALKSIASWPLPPMSLAPFLIYAPLAWLTVRVLRERRPLSDPAWLCIGIGGWVGLQEILLAYGRAPDTRASRYLDMIVVLIVVNFIAMAALLKDAAITRGQRSAGFVLAAVWLVIITSGVGYSAMNGVARDVIYRGQTGKMQVENVRQYLATGDMAYLKDKPLLQVPYPNAERLAGFLNMPEIRGILPPELLDDPAARAAMQARLASGGLFAPLAWKLRTWLPAAGPYIGFAGVALFFLAGLVSGFLATRSQRAARAAADTDETAPAAAPNPA
ncbi:hypothetical protein [Roseixanthobacter liquoris]|uniref:hypothetical protein n=1 Tax=Roseixanthobacter liquoris TaxID=3119921 RepID=UPI00372B7165